MPITVNIVDHPATSWTKAKATTSEKLLEASSPRHHRRCQKIIQSSFSRSGLGERHVSASDNGFVWAAFHAYSAHHHLVIRPEDVWFAILTQLSFFINAHAEELRSFFVTHDGHKELEAVSDVADFGSLAVQMTELISKNVRDPELRDWVMPSFSTTTPDDKVVGAVLFMGAMQKYFSYTLEVTCGLPSVTLLGEINDWKEILRRLDKIDALGEGPRQFAAMLRPILRHMIMTFEDPASQQVTHFWNTIVHKHELFSGTDYLTGWLTAFCFWGENGAVKQPNDSNTQLGGVAYPTVDIDKIPSGFASVPVLVNDNGSKYSATMIAGSVGITARDANVRSNESTERLESDGSSDAPSLNTIQAMSGWWIYKDEDAEAQKVREAEKKRLQDEIEQLYATDLDFTALFEMGLRELTKRLRELEAF